MCELPQIIGLRVNELPGHLCFSILGIMFPLAGLFRIILQREDSFRCCGKKSCVIDRDVGAEQLAMGVLEHIDVYGHARGVCIVFLDDEREVDGVYCLDSRAALLNMFDKSRGEGVGVERDGFAQLADSHVVDDKEDESGFTADARVVEGVILDSDFPDSLKFLALVYVILIGRGIGADSLGNGKSLAVLCSVDVCGVMMPQRFCFAWASSQSYWKSRGVSAL